MNNTGLGNLDDLFQSAQDDGLTDDTLDLVISNLNGPTMATAVGMPLDQLASSEVTLAMNIMDMSGSMTSHAADLMHAYNDSYLGAMTNSLAADDILVSTILFNDDVFDYVIKNGRSHHIPDPDLLKFVHTAVPIAELAPDMLHPQTGQTLQAIAQQLLNQTEIAPEPSAFSSMLTGQ